MRGDSRARPTVTEEFLEETVLMVPESLEIELRGDRLLIAGVMIDAADACSRSTTDLLGGRRCDPVLEETR